MACIHEQCPSPSLSGFNTPMSEGPLFRRPDSDAAPCTPDTELTPTQCVLRNVLSIEPVVGDGSGSHTRGNTPTPSDEHFSNSVLKLHEGGAEGGAMRSQSDSFRLQAGGGGFLEGLFGCLKPVWTMIGKAYSTENKQTHEGEPLTCNACSYDSCCLKDAITQSESTILSLFLYLFHPSSSGTSTTSYLGSRLDTHTHTHCTKTPEQVRLQGTHTHTISN